MMFLLFLSLVIGLSVSQLDTRIVNRSCRTKEDQVCVFPFKFRGKEYNKCTYAGGSSTAWCATRTSSDGSVVTNQWGDCDTDSNSLCQIEQTPSTCTTVGGPDSGNKCVFPFTYNNQVYYDCAPAGTGGVSQPWCSTQTLSDGTHLSGNYGICPSSCSSGAINLPCTPGTMTLKNCNTCVCNKEGGLVCTTFDCSDDDDDTTGDICRVLPGSPAGPGVRCVFPFKWDGTTHFSCTPWTFGGPSQGRDWCSTKTDSDNNHINGEGNFGFCSNSCLNTRRTEKEGKDESVVFEDDDQDTLSRFRQAPN